MSAFGSSKAAVGEGEGVGVAAGLVVTAGLSGADAAGDGVAVAAGFFAAVGALGLAASFFAAGGLAGGCAAGGVSEICAVAPAIVISKPASSDMGRRSFMVRRYPCPALSGLGLFFPNAASYASAIACAASASAALAPRGSAQMKSPTSTKSAPAVANSAASSRETAKP